MLYPHPRTQTFFLDDPDSFSPAPPPLSPQDMLEVAQRNYELMEGGIKPVVAVQIPRNSWLANGILAFYLSCSVCVLYLKYRQSVKKAHHQRLYTQKALTLANDNLSNAKQQLEALRKREAQYQREIAELKKDLKLVHDRVRNTEDEALTEMETLEEKLRHNTALRQSMQTEVERLTEELEAVETSRKRPSKKEQKRLDRTQKRFNTLYKNLEIGTKAVEGYLELNSNLQLRAEEFIHNLNLERNKIPVKRKVFTKRGSETAFESEFAYRGRIYWRKGQKAKTQVLVIGTKNSQSKDLTYLESL